MHANTLRLIRQVDDAPTAEVIKEFFYLIGCFFCDKPMRSKREAEEELREDIGADIDIVLNFNVFQWEQGLPEKHEITQQNESVRVQEEETASFGECPYPIVRNGHRIFVKFEPPKHKKMESYQRLIDDLIHYIWDFENETEKQVLEVNRLYFKYGLLGYLQSKRSLRIMNMGEALELDIGQAPIPANDYIGCMLIAFDRFYQDSVELQQRSESSYARYASINIARKTREVFQLLERTPPALEENGNNFRSITYCSASFLFEELRALYHQAPQNPGTLLLAAHVCQSEPSQERSAGFYYQQIFETIARRDQRAYSFVYYEYGRYIERIEGNWDRAFRYYKRASDLDPLNYRANFKLACHEARNKNFSAAWMSFSGIIEIIQRNFSGYTTTIWENLSLPCTQYLFKTYIWMWKICRATGNYSWAQVCLHNASMAAEAYRENACLRMVYSSDSRAWKDLDWYHRRSKPVILLEDIVKTRMIDTDILHNGE